MTDPTPIPSFSDLASSYKKDIAMTTAQLAAARADVELEFARVKLFWAKYGHPALYALTAIVSAYVGHKL